MERYGVASVYPLRNLLSAANEMSEVSLKVAKFIFENPRLVASMTIGELAKASGSSKTMIVRVAKISGYDGYRGLRAALIEHNGAVRGANLLGIDLPSSANRADSFLEVSRAVVKINIEALQDTLSIIDEGSTLRAVTAILRAKRLLFYGFGGSAAVAQDACIRFLRLQIPSSSYSDSHVLAHIIANAGPDDLLFCVSYTGTTRDIVEALKTASKRGTPTILLTSMPRSAATEFSDITLVSAVRREPRLGESVAVRVAQLVMIDIICAMLVLKMGNKLDAANDRIEAELHKKRVVLNKRRRAEAAPPRNFSTAVDRADAFESTRQGAFAE